MPSSVDGLVAIYTYEDLDGRVAEPLPLLIPHPALHAPKTNYPLANGIVNHVGEAVVMVVATDRYLAEDAVDRIRVEWEILPAVVGLQTAFEARQAVHEDVPDNVAAHMVQLTGDVDAAIAAAPHSLELNLHIERGASMPLEGKGVYARWDADDRSLRVYSSTQTSTSVRFAIAAKLDLPVDRVEVVTPDVGGGFGVKIMHPWPEEVLVPWAAIRLGREVKWTEDRREHFISSAHERAQEHTVRVGFDDEGHLLGLDVRFLHDNGAYTPVRDHRADHLLDPAARPVQAGRLPGRVPFALHQHGAGDPVPRRRPRARLLRDGAGHGRGGRRRRGGQGRGARTQHDPARRAAVRPGPDVPGRPAAHLRHGRLPDLAAQGHGPGRLGGVRAGARAGRRAAGRRVGIGIATYVEGTGVGPYEGAHVRVETTGHVVVATGLTTQGQGHETVFAQIAAQELGVTVDRVTVTTGDTRRFKYGVGTFASRAAVMSGNAVADAARKVRAKALRLAAAALAADESELVLHNGEISVRGFGDGPTIASGHRRRALQPAALRLR